MIVNADTSAEAVEQLCVDLAEATLEGAGPLTQECEDTLRALAAERDAAQAECGAWRASAVDIMDQRDAARAEAARLRRGWLATIQTENSCGASGSPCAAKRCGCVEELEMLLREDDARAAPEPRHD